MNMPPPSTPPGAVPPKKSGGCVKGCLITVAILLIISGIAAYFVVQNIGSMTRQFSSAAIDKLSDEMLKDAQMDPVQKGRVDAVVKGFTAKIRSGEVGLQQGLKVMETLVQGPFIGFVMASSFHTVYLKNSGLPPAEIQEGKTTVGRFTQGIMHQKISEAESEPIFDLFTVKKDESGKSRTLKNQLSDEEVRVILSKMKTAADGVNIPPVPTEIDIAAELQRAIDTGLKATE